MLGHTTQTGYLQASGVLLNERSGSSFMLLLGVFRHGIRGMLRKESMNIRHRLALDIGPLH